MFARHTNGWRRCLDSTEHGSHSTRRTKVTLICDRTENLRVVRLLLARSKRESRIQYLGRAVDDALKNLRAVGDLRTGKRLFVSAAHTLGGVAPRSATCRCSDGRSKTKKCISAFADVRRLAHDCSAAYCCRSRCGGAVERRLHETTTQSWRPRTVDAYHVLGLQFPKRC